MSEEHKTRKKSCGDKLMQALKAHGIHRRTTDLLEAADIRELTLTATYADGSVANVQYTLRPTIH